MVRYSSSASSSRLKLTNAAWRAVRTSMSMVVSCGSITRSAAVSSAFTSAWSPTNAAWSAARRSNPDHPTALHRIVDRVDHGQVLLGRDREQLRHPGQPPRHRQLQGAPPLRFQPAQGRLADAIVTKAHRLMHPRLGHEQPVVERGRKRMLHHVRRLGGRRLQQAQLGAAAQTGHRFYEPPRCRRQGLAPRRQQPRHVRLA